jgi:signal transduction histidine kinase
VVAIGGTATLLALGYRATRGWQESSELLKARDTAAAADLLVKAFTRDMSGMQSRVLASGDWAESLGSLADTSTQLSTAFTRYPYPESFFSWRSSERRVVFFNRTDRHPAWMPGDGGSHRFPVFLVFDPAGAEPLRRRIDAYGSASYRYVVFNTTLGGEPYQIVARLLYSDTSGEQPDAVMGFTVNLSWIRRSYFSDVVSEVERVTDTHGGLRIDVFDHKDGLIYGGGMAAGMRREFPLLFADPSFDKVAAPPPGELHTWSVRVAQADDSPLNLLAQGADQALNIAAAASLMLCLSLVLAIRSVRTEAALASMRSDFVSSVTHELKMPLANISILADSLALRPSSADKIQRYAAFLRQESRRLSQLIDNLLAYARITDVAQVYTFEPLAVPDLVHAIVQTFQHMLAEREFELHVDIPADLPSIRADRAAMALAISNLVDNAIRYSRDGRVLDISAWSAGSAVVIEVGDRGTAHPDGTMPLVRGRFVTEKGATPHGSGLGLAIVARVVADHRGTFTLENRAGGGIAARLTVPAARD